MKRLSHLAALAVVVALAAAHAEDKKDRADPSKPANPAFRKVSLDDAVKAAKAEKKVVMIDFYADWCGPCKQLDAQTFAKDDVKKLLTDKTVAIKVDVDTNKELSKKYEIKFIPTIVFVDGEGKEVGRFTGFKDAEKFVEEVEKHVKK